MGKKMTSVVIASVLFLGMSMGAYAASNVKEIKAFLQGDVKFTLNGEIWKPKDAKGNQVIPISYQGTTYVPLKTVTDALNVPLEYDVTKKTYTIGEKRDGVTLYSNNIKAKSSMMSGFKDLVDKKQLIFDGKQYQGAYVIKGRYIGTGDLKLDLGKPYSKMHLILVAKGDMNIQVCNESDQVLTEIALKKDEVTELDVDIIDSQYPYIMASSATKEERELFILKDSYVK